MLDDDEQDESDGGLEEVAGRAGDENVIEATSCSLRLMRQCRIGVCRRPCIEEAMRRSEISPVPDKRWRRRSRPASGQRTGASGSSGPYCSSLLH